MEDILSQKFVGKRIVTSLTGGHTSVHEGVGDANFLI